MSDRHRITTVLYESEWYSDDDKAAPPQSAVDFLGWLTDHINSVPAEHRVNVGIEFGSDDDYDYPRPRLTVSWWRWETDEELAVRSTNLAQRKAAEAAREQDYERKVLAALKAKYET